ncbi:MAG: DNA mismatch repair protein MutS [Candidatus Woesearchaeota archaeon]
MVEEAKEGNNSNNPTSSNNVTSVLDIDHDLLTPGMQQYQEVKKLHPDCLVMLRMGDFYEMFYQDAATAARELEITLTSRGKGDKRAPLAGIPFHALEPYLGRLVKKGYKVAIVEQLEDPKLAKGLVKRGLVRIVTPGTIIESSMLNERENNYIFGLTAFGDEYALAVCDMSTGEFFTTLLENVNQLYHEFARYSPSECVIPESLKVDVELLERLKNYNCFMNSLDDRHFSPEKARELLLNHFKLHNLETFGLEEHKLNVSVSGGLLKYLIDTQKNSLSHLKKISLLSSQNKMWLDSSTLRNLELIRNIKDNGSRGSLLSVLDKNTTCMGARLLKKWIKEPLLNKEVINQRLDAIEELNQRVIVREETIELLAQVYDIERLVSKVNYGNANPRDLLSLRNSLGQLPLLKNKLSKMQSLLLREISNLEELKDTFSLLQTGLRDDAPISTREGGIIKSGYNSELDELHNIKHNSKKFLQELEEKEKQKTGLPLRLGYTKIFGYFFEVTRRHAESVPSDWIRKQTTVNTERYISEELKLIEEKILGAEEKIFEIEYNLFQDLLKKVAEQTVSIQETALKISVLDVLCGLSKVALENNYCKPEFVDERVIQVQNARHPVVEKQESGFVANDIFLSQGEMMIITGPNMAGKSTLMRQVALISLMAQMGSFVPADKAVLGIVDRIFTRVGAYDDLSSGQSTFMIEMTETAAILNSATEQSLIILDEIGRGTSTFDGVSIAWSVAEYIYNRTKAKTLFSTHYHVLNKLAEKFPRMKNYNIAVREVKGEVIFLHKLVSGGTDESYGIHVAKLAGLPEEVISRAKEIQELLVKDDDMMRKIKAKKLEEQMGLDKF